MLQARNAQSPAYYLTPDCPTEEGELEARWGGKGSLLMGLGEEFDQQAFLRLAKGLNPETGDRLTARLRANRIDATDFTITVPKSVSVLIEVAQDERVKDALWEANDYAMRLVEKKAKVRVRKDGAQQDRESGNIAFASFYHGTTRPILEKTDPSTAAFYANGVEIMARSANDNQPTPDPNAHIHNFVFNLSYDRQESQWKALKRHHFDLKEIEGKMHDHLARSLLKLGYQLDRTKTAFEVRGISEDVLSLYSRRQGEIKEAEAERPYLNAEAGNKTHAKRLAAAKAQLSQVVRQPKPEKPLNRTDLHRSWVSRLTGQQFGDLADLAEKAKSSARRSRWRSGVRNYLDRFRQSVNEREPSRERSGLGR